MRLCACVGGEEEEGEENVEDNQPKYNKLTMPGTCMYMYSIYVHVYTTYIHEDQPFIVAFVASIPTLLLYMYMYTKTSH